MAVYSQYDIATGNIDREPTIRDSSGSSQNPTQGAGTKSFNKGSFDRHSQDLAKRGQLSQDVGFRYDSGSNYSNGLTIFIDEKGTIVGGQLYNKTLTRSQAEVENGISQRESGRILSPVSSFEYKANEILHGPQNYFDPKKPMSYPHAEFVPQKPEPTKESIVTAGYKPSGSSMSASSYEQKKGSDYGSYVGEVGGVKSYMTTSDSEAWKMAGDNVNKFTWLDLIPGYKLYRTSVEVARLGSYYGEKASTITEKGYTKELSYGELNQKYLDLGVATILQTPKAFIEFPVTSALAVYKLATMPFKNTGWPTDRYNANWRQSNFPSETTSQLSAGFLWSGVINYAVNTHYEMKAEREIATMKVKNNQLDYQIGTDKDFYDTGLIKKGTIEVNGKEIPYSVESRGFMKMKNPELASFSEVEYSKMLGVSREELVASNYQQFRPFALDKQNVLVTIGEPGSAEFFKGPATLEVDRIVTPTGEMKSLYRISLDTGTSVQDFTGVSQTRAMGTTNQYAEQFLVVKEFNANKITITDYDLRFITGQPTTRFVEAGTLYKNIEPGTYEAKTDFIQTKQLVRGGTLERYWYGEGLGKSSEMGVWKPVYSPPGNNPIVNVQPSTSTGITEFSGSTGLSSSGNQMTQTQIIGGNTGTTGLTSLSVTEQAVLGPALVSGMTPLTIGSEGVALLGLTRNKPVVVENPQSQGEIFTQMINSPSVLVKPMETPTFLFKPTTGLTPQTSIITKPIEETNLQEQTIVTNELVTNNFNIFKELPIGATPFPFFMPGALGNGGKGLGLETKSFRSLTYMPDLFSAIFSIKGTQPKVLTGFEIRPIGMGSTKKRRKKR